MTETLLQKLEEKAINVLTELERLRGELKQLKHENHALRNEKEGNTRKLQDLMALLDASSFSDATPFLQEEASAA